MGVEIECYNEGSRYAVTHVAKYVCRDGSLPHNGGEIKLCAPENKLEDVAADTVQRSRLVGNKVNTSCGLHVHMQLQALKSLEWISSWGFRSSIAQRVQKFVEAVQPFMFDIVPPSRKENSYCNYSNNWNDMFDHHNWIAFSSRIPTIEIRIHSGTMNPWKVKGWINAWKQVRPDLDKIVSSVEGWEDIVDKYRNDGFLGQLKQDTIGYKYIRARSSNGGRLKNFGFSSGN